MQDFTELKQKHRATWAAGDYNQIAQGIQAVADHVVRSGRIRAGERVLDLACGTGNTALTARARSAAVTGLDLTPELLAIAQKRATEEGYGDIPPNSLPICSSTGTDLLTAPTTHYRPRRRRPSAKT